MGNHNETPAAATSSGMTDWDKAVVALASLDNWPYSLTETECIVQEARCDPATMCAGLQDIIHWAITQRVGQSLPDDPKAALFAHLHHMESYSLTQCLTALPGWPHDYLKTHDLIKGLMSRYPDVQAYEVSPIIDAWARHGTPDKPIEKLQEELHKAYLEGLVCKTIQEERTNAAKKAHDGKAKH